MVLEQKVKDILAEEYDRIKKMVPNLSISVASSWVQSYQIHM